MSDHNALDPEKMAEYVQYAERVPLYHGTEQPPSYADLAVVALVNHIQVIERRARVLGTINSRVESLVGEFVESGNRISAMITKAAEAGEKPNEAAVNVAQVMLGLGDRYEATVSAAVAEAR